jgi:hypothetical protein
LCELPWRRGLLSVEERESSLAMVNWLKHINKNELQCFFFQQQSYIRDQLQDLHRPNQAMVVAKHCQRLQTTI